MLPETQPGTSPTLRDVRIAAGRSVSNICTATMIRPDLLLDWEAGRVITPDLIIKALAAMYQKSLETTTAAANASREQRKEEDG